MLHTLRISGLIGLGPLEEKETTVGAMTSVVVSVERIVAVGYLGKKKKLKTLIRTTLEEVSENLYF